ncbi:M56 family metallopeptidase [Dyella mobilis]|uniref:TonB family protein n=1 Tax=Dyella mobilis TaxID=1849582 RepID=A0ABS2KLT2_9GAMM|nr:M56 family metallopeptidase [Dyella mobilis]MBM7131990.1 TonB family protein [Dyella mobilis]GLQ96026.1 transcriptional regulator [Dyella mobilis]
MASLLLYVLLMSSLGLTLALLLRKPVRHAFGAGPAFTLWALPALLALAPWLPMPTKSLALPPVLTSLPAQTWLLPGDTPANSYAWLIALWLLGAAYGTVNLVVRYVRLARTCRPLPESMHRRLLAEHPTLGKHSLWLHVQGPAILWAPRSRLLLPADFLDRYDTEARDMVLRHECSHLQRGDAWWCLLSECALALLWFHPLAWFALPRFQLDQELACDERVLRASPEHELRYARALMRSHGVDAQPAMIPWLAESQLKERLTMISRRPHSKWRRRFGYVVAATLLASGVVVAQTHNAAPAGTSSGPAPDYAYNLSVATPYPADAVKNHEEGMVMLKVLVSTDGTALRIDIDQSATKASPELAKAASDAVMKWHFNPQLQNGRPTESWVKVPVLFSLNPLPPRPHGPPPPPGALPPPPGNGPPPPPPPPPPGGPVGQSSSNS